MEAKRTHKHAFFAQGQRCLVPVTGFFEWRHEGKVKVPYHRYQGRRRSGLGGLGEEHDGWTPTRCSPLARTC
ncbi:MAG: SOS response-associated peptidase family protein [Flavobacteriales bacterium]|nr:SOS response-associated peptidase family protein [Flavobacteriales bacterium]